MVIEGKRVYQSNTHRTQSLKLYDAQLAHLGCDFEDLYLETSFGRTHIVKTGNLSGTPLLMLHGGNTTTAYNLLAHRYLLPHFCIYAVDIVGQPGKSAENCLSPRSLDYGRWLAKIIAELGFSDIICHGISYGAGIITKLMAVEPQKIRKCMLEVPTGICNGFFPWEMLKMLRPLLAYRVGRKNSHLLEIAAIMTKNSVADQELIASLKDSFDNVRTRASFPSNISKEAATKCDFPVLVVATGQDCFLNGGKIIERSERLFKNITALFLKDRGHIFNLSEAEEKNIIRFLLG